MASQLLAHLRALTGAGPAPPPATGPLTVGLLT